MAEPTPAPEILLFARGLIALLDLWPALTIAVREQWGGHQSAEKKTWLASVIIDEFESGASYTVPSSADPIRHVDAAASAADPPLDVDQIADLLAQVMSDEFEAAVEDGSLDPLAADITRLWRDVLSPSTATAPERTAEDVVGALERKAAEVSLQGVKATSGGGAEDVDEDGDAWESDSDEDDEDENDAPNLVPAQPKERKEDIVDDDGFTLVQKRR